MEIGDTKARISTLAFVVRSRGGPWRLNARDVRRLMGLDGVELIMAYEDAFDLQFKDTDAIKMFTPADVIDFIFERVPTVADGPVLEQRAFHVVRASVMEMTPHQRRAIRPITPLSHLFMLVPPRDLSKRLEQSMKLPESPPLDQLSTVWDLVEWLVGSAPHVVKRGEPWTRAEIAQVVKQITLRQMGDIEYGENLRFVEDMGID